MMYPNHAFFTKKLITVYLIILMGFCHNIIYAETIANYIPKNHYLQDFIKTDLNQDGKTDYLLLTKSMSLEAIEENRFEQVVDRNRRGIIVLLKQDIGYQKIAENLTLFDSEFEDGGVYFPPDLSINIIQDKITFHYAHGRYGYWFYTFRCRILSRCLQY